MSSSAVFSLPIAGQELADRRGPTPDAAALIAVFNACFAESERTVLVGGGAEPEYLPATETQPARIIFREDFASSALHEIAHWCLAGAARRQLHDFGYWYQPDGRNAAQQAEFERVEVKPQAVEWALSRAAGIRFNLSADNLAAGPQGNDASAAFRQAVFQQCQHYFSTGLPPRAQQFFDALQQVFRQGEPVSAPQSPC
ncbi:elongation factor P hydroxylase [Permianibacter fluminis]|uniref:elongation factor P hydroxylase n=1 Tax=Permianibacter fluminis TaxID=2738515 RepID=UPI001B7D7A93|nr:elongation factor P hydroxylase [Permianibacter fluminis]